MKAFSRVQFAFVVAGLVLALSGSADAEAPGANTAALADTCYASGDFDGNGIALTVADYVFALRVMLGYEPPPANLYEFDLNGDCVVDTADASVLTCYFTYGVSCFRSPFPVRTCCSPTLVTYTCPIPLTGDVTKDGRLTTADIILTVCYGFGCEPSPCQAVAADVNCSGNVTSADIIYLVNYIFKGGPPPCDVCLLLFNGGAWQGACPF
jgi:hypothetical protein